MADRYCSNCGQELRPGAGFCSSCGQPSRQSSQPLAQERVASATPPQQHPRQQGTWGSGRILLLVIVVPVLLAVAWFVFQFAVGFLNGLLVS